MTTTAPAATDVLIAGAGPVGLALAVDLARRGIPVRIVDTLSAPTDESRAIVVHSRTLDHFETLGMLKPILDRAVISTGMEIHDDGKTVASVGFDSIRAAHPYSVSLVQSETEAILAGRLAELGVRVERGTTLTGFTGIDGGMTCVVTDANSAAVTIRASYLVGTDGARSAVRHLTGERLTGSFAGEDVVLGDIEADHDYERSHFHAFFSPGQTSGLLFPLTSDRVRVFAQLPDGTDPKREVTADWLQQLMEERGIRARITGTHWLTRFELKHGQVPDYRHGRVFLAGDAAHIHSPAGALGMNTGIQDAMNLGWKLARAVRDHDGERLLDSYQRERHPVGAHVVALTTEITDIATVSNPALQELRNALMHVGVELRPLIDRMADEIEQQRIHYRDSRVVTGYGRRLRPGDFLFLANTGVSAALAATDDHVIVAVPEMHGEHALAPITVGLPVIQAAASDLPALREATGLHHGGLIIVRPDGYIGSISADLDHAVPQYLRLLGDN
ncbi:FAD-dependent monooxygenase [Leifsonia sp. NPDC058194]|uniref:FAD-dependent monooxygenase n=1 Tax=Leifsonia sp. NPDC058194 TaxID=3346374 RepID=UPI0036DED0C6